MYCRDLGAERWNMGTFNNTFFPADLKRKQFGIIGRVDVLTADSHLLMAGTCSVSMMCYYL